MQRIVPRFARAGLWLVALALVVGLLGSASTLAAADTTNEAHAVALQPDGKVVVAGRSLNATGKGDWTFALARYNPDGRLDPSFGRDGRVVTAIGANGAEAYAVALQPDGQIVAAGRVFTRSADGNPVFALARYNPDGSLDTAFGENGVVMTAIGSESTARAVAIQDDGRIVAAGIARTQADTDFAVARYTPAGALDPEFGANGLFAGDFTRHDDGARGLALQPDGKIVLAGYATDGGHTAFALFRLNRDGSLDPTFNTNGGVVSSIAGNRDSEAHAVALQPDGKLVVGGLMSDGWGKRFALVRYNPDGSVDARVEGKPDSGFNEGGVVTTQFCSGCINDAIQSLAIQPDGKIVAAGHSNRSGGFAAAVARYTPAGALDPAFGDGGLVTTAFDKTGWINGIALQADGRVVGAGTAAPVSSGDFALIRYTPDGAPDPSFGGGLVKTSFSNLPR